MQLKENANVFSVFCSFLSVELSKVKLDNSSIFLKSVLKMYFKIFTSNSLIVVCTKKLLSRHTEVQVVWCCTVTSDCLVLFKLSPEPRLTRPLTLCRRQTQSEELPINYHESNYLFAFIFSWVCTVTSLPALRPVVVLNVCVLLLSHMKSCSYFLWKEVSTELLIDIYRFGLDQIKLSVGGTSHWRGWFRLAWRSFGVKAHDPTGVSPQVGYLCSLSKWKQTHASHSF